MDDSRAGGDGGGEGLREVDAVIEKLLAVRGQRQTATMQVSITYNICLRTSAVCGLAGVLECSIVRTPLRCHQAVHMSVKPHVHMALAHVYPDSRSSSCLCVPWAAKCAMIVPTCGLAIASARHALSEEFR